MFAVISVVTQVTVSFAHSAGAFHAVLYSNVPVVADFKSADDGDNVGTLKAHILTALTPISELLYTVEETRFEPTTLP